MDVTLDLSEERYEQLTARADRQGFESPERYAAVVVETVLDELEGEDGTDEAVQDRLEDLGYL
jgi:hypothetical protein